MKWKAVLVLIPLFATVQADNQLHHRAIAHKRQASSTPSSARPSSSAASASASSSSVPASSRTASGSASATLSSSTTIAAPAGPPSFITGTDVAPLASITFGMPTQSTLPVTMTYAAGVSPPISGAPPLPSPFVFRASDWPAQDKTPDPDSPEVQEWMKELRGFNIPDIPPTVDGSCVNDTAAAADAANRGWWTCGGHTRVTDIVACPDKYTWGVSFDDGPAKYTQKLLGYLDRQSILATFFVVGSRVIERPNVLIEEYMAGHEISVHTWSHKHLTSLSTAGVVAELGWTRKAIKEVLGVTPTTMRPPYGDIDDRVRAISLAMGMVPIIWTQTPSAGKFDTNDWQVAGGSLTGNQSFATFQAILGNASLIDTGFIVLQHDLFEITVDLAIGYTLPAALNNNPHLTLKPIGQCSRIPSTDLYLESNTNKTFPPHHQSSSSLARYYGAVPASTLLMGTVLAAIGFFI